jgi:hypothetical protein
MKMGMIKSKSVSMGGNVEKRLADIERSLAGLVTLVAGLQSKNISDQGSKNTIAGAGGMMPEQSRVNVDLSRTGLRYSYSQLVSELATALSRMGQRNR